MQKYFIALNEFFTKFKSGLTANAVDWAGEPETPAIMQAHLDDIAAADADVEAAIITLSQKRTASRAVRDSKTDVRGTLNNRVKGIYPDNFVKWPEFGVTVPVTDAPDRTAPTYQHNVNIIDDTDGQGFILSIQKDNLADYYEWEKGQSANPSDTNTIPPLTAWRTNNKIKLVDDEVDPGLRYWYRVRSVNNHGVGPWSEAASRVQ
jgi:hypothetical protein